VQLTNSITSEFLPKARGFDKPPFQGREAAPANRVATFYSAPSNDAEYRSISSYQAKFDSTQSVTSVDRIDDLQTRLSFKYQLPKNLPSHAKAAVSTYHRVAEALPPQKVELLGIDIFA
jgi:hypothetical protein